MPYKLPPSEPIAVVASSCRFAGGVTSPSKLWDLLRQPTDLSRNVPPSRFNVRAFFHPDGDYHGTTDSPKAYWLDDYQDIREFDAGFFGIAPKEAEAVDPQQRLLLETVFEALESAGYQLPQWAGKDVAVYVGAMTADFYSVSLQDDLTTSPYYATGNARSILSNRISYFYDFHGPSVTIDTACSSSLVALHQAVLGLRAGDCSAACVAGVNLMLTPEQFVVESSLHMLSPTGHCHMWDSRADGYARGEGAAVLFLKPLRRALADGDGPRIQALIRETGVNSDGRTAGITMPSPTAQASLIRATYTRAGLDITDPADRCQYFEAHGTGTPVGDPREASAIYSAFFKERDDHSDKGNLAGASAKSPRPLLVGSVKTVIGHTEGAAGLAGILKVMLAMKNGQVPPNLHMEKLASTVAPFCTPAPQGYLQIPTELMKWPAAKPGHPLRASVNSFGFGGTNAHAIVEKYDPSIHSPHLSIMNVRPSALRGTSSLPQIPLFLSASSASTLRSLAKNYLDFLQNQLHGNSALPFEELAWRAYTSRTHFLYRLAICGNSLTDAINILSEQLSDASNGQTKDLGFRARRIENTANGDAPQLLGVFTGQGAQWPGMSKDLFSTNRVYRESIRNLDSVLRACPDPPSWTLEEELQKLDADGSRVREAAVAQPLCTALQIGLIDVLDRLGLHFTSVIGHSSGEIGAAYAAKYISRRDAILIAYYRGKSVSTPMLPQGGPQQPQGGMLAVGLSREDADAFCEAFDGRLCVAASNSPSSSTLSGDMDAVLEAEQQLRSRSIFVRRLLVDKAYHSHHMARLSDSYTKALDACQISPLAAASDPDRRVTWISSVFPGDSVPTKQQLRGSYWVDNMVKPVLFREAAEKVLSTVQGEFDCAIEIGPHSTLKGPFSDTLAQLWAQGTASSKGLPYTSLLQRGKSDATSFLEFLGFVWTHYDPPLIDLHGLLDDQERDVLSDTLSRQHGDVANMLPAYPWDHSQKYYRYSRIARQFHHKSDPPHELLGSRTRDDIDGHELRWRNLLRVDKLPWLAHHAFQGQPLLPASAYCIMACEAAKTLLSGREATVVEVEDIEFISGIPLEVDGPATEIMFSLNVHHQPGKTSNATSAYTDQNDNIILASFSIFSGSESSRMPLGKRCSGNLRVVLGSPSADVLPRREDPAKLPETFDVSTEAFYKMMADVGLRYSGPFEAIESMRRRLNFASATLKRIHAKDTTSLPLSPATLDSCLQTCFMSYSSPGDSMAHSGVGSTHLSVDAQLTNIQEPTSESPARITGDICIFNEDGNMEVCIEGLTVGSLASAHPSADRDLYLHTVYVPDPDDSLVNDCAILGDTSVANEALDRVLEESILRIQSFYEPSPKSSRIWPTDTDEVLTQHILSSPYSLTLGKVKALAKDNAQMTSAVSAERTLQSLLEEGRHVYHFQRRVSSIVKQIAHKYPRISVFNLTDSEMHMSTPILDGLSSSFISYISMVLGNADQSFNLYLDQFPMSIKKKVRSSSLVQIDGMKPQLNGLITAASIQPFDLAILSTSIFKRATSSEVVLDYIKSLMRPGGFLMLVHMPLQMSRGQQSTDITDTYITPPDWPDLLDRCGFMTPAIKNTDQYFAGGFSIAVRRSKRLPQRHLVPNPSALSAAVSGPIKPGERLLVVGGQATDISLLASSVGRLLSSHMHNPVTTVTGLDELGALTNADPASSHAFTCAIVLADVDDTMSVLSSLNESRLDTLRKVLFRPEMVILWVTKGARVGNCESASSYGFIRSIRGEMPNLFIQMLDFDHLESDGGKLLVPSPPNIVSPSAASMVTDVFLQLLLGVAAKRNQNSFASANVAADEGRNNDLWHLETEVFIDSMGQRLVPRMLPLKPSNDTFNASRRAVTEKVNTLLKCVELAHDATTGEYSINVVPAPVPSSPFQIKDVELSRIQVHYSSAQPLFKGHYVCIGLSSDTGDIVAAISKSNASFVSVPRNQLCPIPDRGNNGTTRPYAGALVGTLVCLQLLSISADKPLALVAPENILLECAQHVSAHQGRDIVAIQVAGGDHSAQILDDGLFLHPHATYGRMASTLYRFKDGATFVNFLPENHPVSRFLSRTVPANCCSYSWASLSSQTQDDAPQDDAYIATNLLQQAISIVDSGNGASADFVFVPDLLKSHIRNASTVQIVDWRAERAVERVVVPHENLASTNTPQGPLGARLRVDRTYVLVGITRDMGQSLSTLLSKQGARHIVLASRNIPTSRPQWAKHAKRVVGVDIRFESLDVTDLAAVQQFRIRVEQSMPRIGGIVNGAMVLDDRVFAQMTADAFSRAMRPKTVGSRNLDTVFRDDDEEDRNKLDFFIMTSSCTAVAGHAGQSNYAAANMYMNGLAANRQRRGVAGSVLNIGVIYGLGFLQREKEELYAGLERERYPPISERDLHHMFLEAIALGRPKPGRAARPEDFIDLTTGLSRFNPHQTADNEVHWHRDPRFSHFTVDDDSEYGSNEKQSGSSENSSAKQLADLIGGEAATAEVIGQQLAIAFSERLATLLHVGPSTSADGSNDGAGRIRSDSSLMELGVDSLVAVEMRAWLWRMTSRDVPVMKILGAASINRLCTDIASDVVASRGQ
ncbi:polyketide synthase [Sporothrix schenckii 1099-18]|uniref:Polyketide synthase n=1 Tax=Sporothrix schenckii 1099-18 TaxID=1397361 RepID=A0A0F2M5X2_SPOSC|nr:polyketide synthase [Sporothrix schenckii 1099-18]KJR84205.1 polyketide synthase [Sporothrix schenckii 1099-18]